MLQTEAVIVNNFEHQARGSTQTAKSIIHGEEDFAMYGLETRCYLEAGPARHTFILKYSPSVWWVNLARCC